MNKISDIEFKRLIDDKFLKYTTFKKGWSGESNSIPPSEITLKCARLLIDNIIQKSITKPEVSLGKDGDISFYWSENKHISLIDLSVYSDSTYSYYAKTKIGVEYFKDNIPVEQFINEAIFTYT